MQLHALLLCPIPFILHSFPPLSLHSSLPPYIHSPSIPTSIQYNFSSPLNPLNLQSSTTSSFSLFISKMDYSKLRKFIFQFFFNYFIILCLELRTEIVFFPFNKRTKRFSISTLGYKLLYLL